MLPERLLRIAGVYNGLTGAVLLLLPLDFLAFLGLESPRYWLFYYIAASTPAVAGVACEVARRRPDLRPGLAFGLMAGNLAAAGVVLVVVVWTELPQVLLASAVGSGLWAWLLWGVYSPEAKGAARGPASPPPEPTPDAPETSEETA